MHHVACCMSSCTARLCLVPPLCLCVQRVAGWFILCELYRNDGYATNPFLPLFVDNFRKQSTVAEKQFLAHLLSSSTSNKEVSIPPPPVCPLEWLECNPLWSQ